jgi:hypothetical protein
MPGRLNRSAWWALIVAALAALAAGALSSAALAAKEGPGWEVTARNYPTNLSPGGSGVIVVDPFNVGAGASSGTVTVTDTLPPGVTATDAGELNLVKNGIEPFLGHLAWDCTGNGQGEAPHLLGATIVTCHNDATNMPSLLGGAGNPTSGIEIAGTVEGVATNAEVGIAVNVAQGAAEDPQSPQDNRVTISGGGAPAPASTRDPITISSKPPAFGIVGWDAWFSNADGTLDTQAGSHPYAATFSTDFATLLEEGELSLAGGEVRNIAVKLPPGVVGDPTAVPQCARAEFLRQRCPRDSQIGVITVSFAKSGSLGFRVFNIVPPPGSPAEFGFTLAGINTFLDSEVRSGSDYGITTRINNVPQREISGSVLTLWGSPGDPSHDRWREASAEGTPCSQEKIELAGNPCSRIFHPLLKPFLTLPTGCADPQAFSLTASSWENADVSSEASFLSHDSNDLPTGFTGCERLGFGPTITTSPDTSQADTPAGLTVDVRPPIGGLGDVEGLGTSDIENTTVTLPQGLVINPGQAAGLRACQPSEDALGPLPNGEEDNGPPSCPLASKVGTAEAESPLLKSRLQGNVYILQSNPPNLQLLVALSGEGVNVKLVGDVHLDETTGQLTSTFKGIPEFPVSDFKLAFSGGAQAALATPTGCGAYTASADFGPWSSPFVADFLTSSSFGITSGSGGAPCSSPLPFSPAMIAGSTTDQAGGFTSFSLLLQQADDQQRLQSLQFKTPEGLLGMISKVPLCGEPQAAQGTCPASSQIGHTVVTSGPGPYPLVVPQPGEPPAPIYLTGGYKGAPYGLSIAVPVITGPFNLGTVVVRSKIEVDPLTSQLTVTTDRFPQILDGVPTDLRTINAVIDRPGFMFNPTSCEPMAFAGTAFSAQGSSAPISSHFQMGSCQSLKFKPDFRVSTAGRTSRRNGASLDVKLVYPATPLGANQASSQSNIKSVKVDLPKQLPSRLTTLQKACTSATFEANPANCPAASRVGQVKAITPVLPVPLTGPAYFVSYGGAKFPELVFVLQGYGVTVDVHAETFISKAGITSSTLRRVPDVPISSFELKLPQGAFSALAANGNLCTSTLKMPTAFTAQNGAVIHQSTPINVTGCPKHRKPKKAGKARH